MTGLLDHLIATPIADAVRDHRAGVLRHAEGVHRALIETEDDRFTHADRVGLALATARAIGDPILVDWFTELAEDAGDADQGVLDAWSSLVTTMIDHPRKVDAPMINSLVAGHGEARVVVVCELVSYLAFLSRLVFALSGGRGGGTAQTPQPGEFQVTMKARLWEPYVAPLPARSLAEVTPAEREAFEATGKGAETGEYYRVLAHDPTSLRERSLMYNLIMYDDGGLPSADREFAALWTSMRNGCPYCASVHVRRLQGLTDRSTAQAALTAAHHQQDHDQLTDRQRVLAAAAEALTDRDATALDKALADARTGGLTETELFDLIAVVAVFGWANRLMLALGSSRER
ncbi:peroxidase-related enzyme [Propionibacteriaceae bacterium Y1685]